MAKKPKGNPFAKIKGAKIGIKPGEDPMKKEKMPMVKGKKPKKK